MKNWGKLMINILQPGLIAKLNIENRVIMSPMNEGA